MESLELAGKAVGHRRPEPQEGKAGRLPSEKGKPLAPSLGLPHWAVELRGMNLSSSARRNPDLDLFSLLFSRVHRRLDLFGSRFGCLEFDPQMYVRSAPRLGLA